MSIGLHDPRLTAYALGELTGAEKVEVESALEESEALRKAVKEIRQIGEDIATALEREASVGLTEEQLLTIDRRAEQGLPSRLWVSLAGFSAAACVLLAFFIASPGRPGTESAQTRAAIEEGTEPAGSSLGRSLPNPSITSTEPLASESRGDGAASSPPTPIADSVKRPFPKPSAKSSAPRVPFDSPDERSSIQRALDALSATINSASQPQLADALPNPVLPSSGLVIPSLNTLPPAPSPGTVVLGAVSDASGAVFPGVVVELKRLGDGASWTTVSGDNGTFAFPGLPSGPVQLRVSVPGFQTYSTRFELAGSTVRVDPVMEIGQVSEMVTVVGRREKQTPLAMIAGELKESRRQPAAAPSRQNLSYTVPLVAPKTAPEEGGGDESGVNTESYTRVDESPFRLVTQHPLSTFSIDVDTASYSNVRRFLNEGALPPPDAVRIEELVNYFVYDYPQPVGADPFSVTTEIAEAPWNRGHLLVRVGLKGRELARQDRPQSNLVFLIDVSGSMNAPNKLPLLVRAMRLLVERLGGRDRVAIVVYAGSSGVALPSTAGSQKASILGALDRLSAGGSTHGSAGIRQAYAIARQNFVAGGINRVILATDGDFNVGTTSHGDLTRLIEKEAKSGVFLSVLGFGMGNYKDSMLESLADKGNGNYGYIDTINEARKLLVEQMDGTLVTIAKDVKVQVEFNPAQVSGYRLIGYENRSLRDEEFNDDTKDAGEIGAGHTVTALYELVPVGAAVEATPVDPLKYQRPAPIDTRLAHELMTVKLRYKRPDQDVSRLMERAVVDDGRSFANSSDDFKFAAAVALFGMLLRDSKYCGDSSYATVLSLANQGLGRDQSGYRTEFVDLVRKAQELAR